MKIDKFNYINNKELQNATDARTQEKPANANAATVRPEDSTKNDVVRLSDRSRMVARSLELANQAPDIREDKVDDLRNRINAGTYNVSGQTVATAMLRKSITEV